MRGEPTYGQANGWTPLIFMAEFAERPGALVACGSSGNGLGLPSAVVVPSTAGSAIRRALADGWLAAEPGPTFMPALEEPAIL